MAEREAIVRRERLRLYALLIPLGMVALGILTAVPALFAFLGLATYVALMRECFRHVVPYRWARRALFLKIDNPSPPPPAVVAEVEKPLVTRIGDGAGTIVYPHGRQTEEA